MNQFKFKNIAIIAHVDHGKTTLVDAMLHQSGVFRSNQKVIERVMDSNDLERERGITILSKNTSVFYDNYKINIIDTPGHADFGGEVERVLKMVEGVLLVVDAFEGPMPQTKFVLRKALELGLVPIVAINKIDRDGSRTEEVEGEVIELFMELGATNEQIDCPIIYTSALDGHSGTSVDNIKPSLKPLFETIISHIPDPLGDSESPLQMLVANLDHDDYVGKLVIGRLLNGVIKEGQTIALIKGDEIIRQKVSSLYVYKGLERVNVSEAVAGDIISMSGLSEASIGDTVASIDNPVALEAIKVDEPTLSMHFLVNDSPFAGQDGQYITSRKLRERLFKEAETNVSLKVEETNSADTFKVSGRGALHLSILIENMRREGYELQVSKPEVVFKEIDGVKTEPIELLVCDISEELLGTVMEITGKRRGEMFNMYPINPSTLRVEFKIPARGLVGFRNEFLTNTKGEGTYSHTFYGYEPYKGELPTRTRGVLIAYETGMATAYGIYNAQDRGRIFISPGEKVYKGMIIGENNREQDMEINIAKKKQMTNVRASGSDEALRLEPPREFSLEQSLEYIADDELVEITPDFIRMRKKYLSYSERVRQNKK
jgi:GTP-binding protein